MTTSAVSAAASVLAASSTSSSAANQLIKLANGEYTASSVSSDQTDANKLGLVKEKDGNYGTSKPTVTASNASAASSSSSSVQSALTSLTLGGE